jgi:hypothetical protein
MAILWFLLGGLVVANAVYLCRWIKRNNVSPGVWAWLGFIAGGLLLFFTIAWCVTSIIEGETQAALMGLLFFCVPAVIVLVVTRRSILKTVG